MISFISGTIENVFDNSFIINNNGIGYAIYATSNTIKNLPSKGENAKIHIHMNVKEGDISLFGFLQEEEQAMFNMLITVSGIGPKGAIGLLSSMESKALKLAIATEDVLALSKARGIGKRTAQRLVLELKDKIKTTNAIVATHNSTERQDAIEALIALGYSKNESVKAVLNVAKDNMPVDLIIKLAMKHLN